MGSHVSPARPDGSAYPLSMPESEWAKRLSPAENRVLRQGGTEPAFTASHLSVLESSAAARKHFWRPADRLVVEVAGQPSTE